jgi:hypothetical protein
VRDGSRSAWDVEAGELCGEYWQPIINSLHRTITGKPTMKPIESLAELRTKAADDPQYDALAVVAARNLGGPLKCSLSDALRFLELNAMESELGEDGVVEEVNFVIDLVPEELERMRRGKR